MKLQNMFLLFSFCLILLMGCTLQIPSHPDNNSNIENDTKVFAQVPETDEIIISIIPIDEAKNALESGEIDYYLAPLNALDVQEIKSSTERIFLISLTFSVLYISFYNQNK